MRKPFTLVEVLIAMSVLSVFLLGLMQFFSSTESVLSSGADRSEMYERARIAMDMMANDISCVYCSQTDDSPQSGDGTVSKTFEFGGDSFKISTIRSEKLDDDAKSNIVGVKYAWHKDGESAAGTLYYSYDEKGDTFDLSQGAWSKEFPLVDGVTDFKVSTICGPNTNLPALVIIRMKLLDLRAMKRIKANPSAKANILKMADVREFRRMVVIDRGQPKPPYN